MPSQTRSQAWGAAYRPSALPGALPASQTARPSGQEVARFVELVLEVDSLLDTHAVDLKRIAGTVRRDSRLTQGIIAFSALLADPPRLAAGSLEEVAVLLGSERFRLALVSSALLDERGRLFSAPLRGTVVKHSLMSAFACGQLAHWSAFHDPEFAYLAGLLHCVAPGGASPPSGETRPGFLSSRPHSPRMNRGFTLPACNADEAVRQAPGGRALASLFEEQHKRRGAQGTLLLEHLLAAACAVSRARISIEASAVPISDSVMQDVTGDALAASFPKMAFPGTARCARAAGGLLRFIGPAAGTSAVLLLGPGGAGRGRLNERHPRDDRG